jgi:hypothetical protein
MANRFNVTTPRAKKDGGTFFLKIGVAFENPKGISVELDALPIADKEGRVKLVLFPADEDRKASAPAASVADDDSIPF